MVHCLFFYDDVTRERASAIRAMEEVEKQASSVQFLNLQDLVIEVGTSAPRAMVNGTPLPPPADDLRVFAKVSLEHWSLINTLPFLGYTLAQPQTQHYSKLEQMLLLQRAGIAVPQSQLCPRDISGLDAYPYIAKPLYGSMGQGVAMVEDAAALEAYQTQHSKPFLLQEVIHPLGKDIRAVVAGGRVVATMERTAPDGDFRANISVGGTGCPTQLTEKEEQLTLRAAHAYGIPVAGLDFIRTSNGPVFIEVNKSPNVEGIEAATGLNVMGEMVRVWLS